MVYTTCCEMALHSFAGHQRHIQCAAPQLHHAGICWHKWWYHIQQNHQMPHPVTAILFNWQDIGRYDFPYLKIRNSRMLCKAVLVQAMQED